MALEGVRGYVQLASGLAEMSRARATEAANALLSLSSGAAGGSLQTQVQDLAEELLAAAAANRRSLLALVRGEIESALAKSLPADELDRARAAVAKLSADVEELREQVLASPAVQAIPEPGRSALGAVSGAAARFALGEPSQRGRRRPSQPAVPSVVERPLDDGAVVDAILVESAEPVVTPPRRRPPRTQISGTATKSAVSTITKAAPEQAAGAAERSAAKKSTGKKAAKKTASKKTASTKTAAKKTAAKKSATKATTKSAAKKSAGKATTKAASTKAATTKSSSSSPSTRSATTKSGARTSATTKSARKRSGGSASGSSS